MTIYHYIGITLFVLFCVAIIWQIHSDMVDTRRSILRAYGLANITHSAKVFEATAVDMLGDIDYMAIEKTSSKKKKQPKSKRAGDESQDRFFFSL